jgi:hypothetical protein
MTGSGKIVSPAGAYIQNPDAAVIAESGFERKTARSQNISVSLLTNVSA